MSGQDDVFEGEGDAEEELDCSSPEVVNKYQFAGNVANGTWLSRRKILQKCPYLSGKNPWMCWYVACVC